MSLSEIAACNQAYAGLASRLSDGRLGSIRAVQVPAVSSFLAHLKKLQTDEELWRNLPADELKKQLRISRSDFRGIIGRQSVVSEYWNERQHSLQSEINTVASFLTTEILDNLNLLAANIMTWGTEAGFALYEEVWNQTSDGPTGLFFPSNRLTKIARKWSDLNPLPQGTRILSRTDFSAVQPGQFERFVVVNSPAALANHRAGPEGPNLLRALLFGGSSAEVVFVTPSNFTRETDGLIARTLLPQDFGRQSFFLKFEKTGESGLSVDAREDFVEPVDDLLDEIPQANPVQTSDAPSLESGAQDCRLIHLKANLALPVETDASWVTRLSRTLDGVWESGAADPFSDLQQGDLLLAQLDASESDDLRQRALMQMSSQYEMFEQTREHWKTQLKLAAGAHSPARFIDHLRKAGIHHAARYEFWLQDDAVGPQTNSDFINLLSFLGFSDEQIALTMRLTKQWRASLIAEGQRPGKEIADYLNREEHDESFFEQGRAVTLEELGNARFLISPVVSVSKTVIQCDPSQIRQVVRSREGELSSS